MNRVVWQQFLRIRSCLKKNTHDYCNPTKNTVDEPCFGVWSNYGKTVWLNHTPKPWLNHAMFLVWFNRRTATEYAALGGA